MQDKRPTILIHPANTCIRPRIRPLKVYAIKKHKGLICNTTSSSNSSQSTQPIGRMLWEELLILSRFYSKLRADEWNLCSSH